MSDIEKIKEKSLLVLAFLKEMWPSFRWELTEKVRASADTEKVKMKLCFKGEPFSRSREKNKDVLLLCITGPHRKIFRGGQTLLRWKCHSLYENEGKNSIKRTLIKVEGEGRNSNQAIKTVMDKIENEIKKVIANAYEDIQDLFRMYQKIGEERGVKISLEENDNNKGEKDTAKR